MKKKSDETAISMHDIPDAFLLKHAPIRPIDGCEGIVAHQSDDLFALWDAWEQEKGGECPTPFWATVWPAAVVLARYLLNNRAIVAEKTVLDLGCGGGVAGIAAVLAGASRVIANDIDPIALAVARRNFAANRVRIETCDSNLAQKQIDVPADLFLVADLFYHRSASAPLLAFLRKKQESGATVLIADGNRPFTPATGITELSRETVDVSKELEGVPQREVKVLMLAKE